MRGVHVQFRSAIGAFGQAIAAGLLTTLSLMNAASGQSTCPPGTVPSAAVTGQWTNPMLCVGLGAGDAVWPDGAMHLIHIPYREPQGGEAAGTLRGRFVIAYSPGCPLDHLKVLTCPGGVPGEEEAPPLGCAWQTPLPARLWNPYAPLATPTQLPFDWVPSGGEETTNVYDCSGHAWVETVSGPRLIIAGGGCGPAQALLRSLTFDPAAADDATPHPWEDVTYMGAKRWYPTCVSLGNGKLIVFSGAGAADPETGGAIHFQPYPEVFDPATGQWSVPPPPPAGVGDGYGAWRPLTLYPYMFLLPDGRIFCAGPASSGGWTLNLDLQGGADWDLLTPALTPNAAMGFRPPILSATGSAARR